MQYLRKLFVGLVFFFAAAIAMAAPVNINTADAETLAAGLINVGPEKAESIIKYRNEHGPFKSIEELANVKGIGEATIEKNEGRMVVGDDKKE